MKKIFDKIKYFFNRTTSNSLTYSELKNIMKQNKNIYLIDVRSNQEYKEGYLQNAINIPIYNLEKEIVKMVKNKDDIIILYCQSDIRSKKGKKLLEKIGYSNIFFLKGGIDGIMCYYYEN